MKKLMLSLSAVLMIWGAAIAQKTVKIIPKAGFNFSYYNDDFEDGKVEGKAGYQLGVDLRFGENFYIAPGVHYIAQNDRLVTEGDDVNIEPLNVEFRTKGVRVPVMLGGDLLSAERFGVRAFGGPAVTFLLGEDNVLKNISGWVQEDAMWGIGAGLGFDLGIISLDLQHEWGLNETLTLDNRPAKNRLFLLSLGILF